MRYRISEIKIDPQKVAAGGGGISEAALMKELQQILEKKLVADHGKRNRDHSVSNIEIVRESVDARKKPDVKLVYTLDFDCEAVLDLDKAKRSIYTLPCIKRDDIMDQPQNQRPVIAGFGPCGIFAALILAEAGYKPIVIERGKAMEDRIADVESFWNKLASDPDGKTAPDPESNVQFGEGGAGTFSDGKLTTGIKDIRIRKVLESFVEAGADPSILYRHRAHIGTDKLRDVVRNLRYKIEEAGGEVRFGTRMEGIETGAASDRNFAIGTSDRGFAIGTDDVDRQLTGVTVRDLEKGTVETIETDALIMAIGHSARDTFRMLYEAGFDMVPKAFSIGVRIQHLQKMINEAQYGDESLASILGPADYKLSYKCKGDQDDNETGGGSETAAGRGVYTFCMCPGGEVINASTEACTSVTNGMSNSARDGKFANSAVLVDVRTSDFAFDGGKNNNPLAGIAFQEKYEHLAWQNRTAGGMASCSYRQFRDANDIHTDGRQAAAGSRLRNSLPAFATEAIIEAIPAFARRLKGFDDPEAIMFAVESRSSSPIRIIRDQNMEASISGKSIRGIVPAGEGPGYAGGIMSAAVDGIRAAERIIEAAENNISLKKNRGENIILA